MDPKRLAAGVFLAGFLTGGTTIFYATRPAPPERPPAPSDTQTLQQVEAVKERAAKPAAGWWDVDAPTPGLPPTPNTNRSIARLPDGPPRWHGGEKPDESEEDRYQRFVAYWTNQTAVARAAFVSNAVLDEAEATRFDVLVAAMNIRLQHALDPVIEQVQTGWRPGPEERARMMGEIGNILAGTYDELDRGLPADWREATISNELNLVYFVDPKYAPYMRGLRGWGPPGGWSRGR